MSWSNVGPQDRGFPGSQGLLERYFLRSIGDLPGGFSGPFQDLRMTSGDLFATSPGGIKGFLGTVAGLVREGSKRKRARKVVKSHRIGTKIRQHGEEDMGSPVFGSPGLERAQKGPKKAKTGFRENPKIPGAVDL